MKKKALYKIVKESLKELIKEQNIPSFKNLSGNVLPIKEPDVGEAILPQNCPGGYGPSQGTISVYGGSPAPCVPQEINDAFICCSSNNSLSNMAGPMGTLNTAWGYPISFAQDFCYPIDGEGMQNGPIENNQFTYAQFNEWYENSGTYKNFRYPVFPYLTLLACFNIDWELILYFFSNAAGLAFASLTNP